RHQNRAAEADAQTAAERSEVPAVFRHEPDTDPSPPANQAWVRRIIAEAAAPGYLDDRPNAPAVAATAALAEVIARGRLAAAGWGPRAGRRSATGPRTSSPPVAVSSSPSQPPRWARCRLSRTPRSPRPSTSSATTR